MKQMFYSLASATPSAPSLQETSRVLQRLRLRDAYAPTGFKGYGVTRRPVKGHEFGLGLSGEDRRALIAFLKTL